MNCLSTEVDSDVTGSSLGYQSSSLELSQSQLFMEIVSKYLSTSILTTQK